jgi:2-haloalkanoic acid dehalogenase type II
MPVKAVIFDAYGTLFRNEDLRLIPQRIVADHGLSASADDVFRVWVDLYSDAIQRPPFRTLRAIQHDVLGQILKQFRCGGDECAYVDLFFGITTRVELYPDARAILSALGPVRAVIVSNADHEHAAAWDVALPVELVLISEALQAYKPDPAVFHRALERLRLPADEVLHVGDSLVDDVAGANAAGLRVAWVNRDGRARRSDAPQPDFEIRELTELARLL